ncbi:sigma-54-dependent Fis family transcriptional regulator [Mediterraneibacter agrestimuris]|uniref:sigma-54-dependent Fis family transcriptional regulator n=1 Tax=Mediterraneibacter agrestimuris TaxID=2941333 RepID=UPI00203C07BE|nr:PrpR N-terminal domain-containing protein [Mediterraneibacter agrestimuris]
MLKQAKKVIKEEHIDIHTLKVIETVDTIAEARKAVENGAEIIVARGAQASYIKSYTEIPLVEIKMTGQELGLLIKKAKHMINKEIPSIAIIGYKNMYSDMSYFEEIFDIKLQSVFINNIDQIESAIDHAVTAGTDLLIGGDVVNRLARQKGIPALFVESTEDSIRNALKIARQMSYTAETEKRHIAQFAAVLDASFNAIIKIDTKKRVTIVNPPFETLIGKKAEQLLGKNILDIVPEIGEQMIDSILNGRRDSINLSVRFRDNPTMLTIAPICTQDDISGAILSCYLLTKSTKHATDKSRIMYLKGYNAIHHFSDLDTENEAMKKCVELGKIYALSSQPVLICGECGTNKELFAQCIHNNSTYKKGPFITLNLSSMSDDTQMKYLFGNPDAADQIQKKGALAASDTGTLLISEIEALAPITQSRLYRALRYKILIQNDAENFQPINNRLIVTTSVKLTDYVNAGSFRKDLYYLINGLVMQIPPLRQRKQDIKKIILDAKNAFAEQYSRFLTFPESSIEVLINYDWPGNEIQLTAFLERLFLTAPHKSIGEAYVRYLLDELYPVQTDSPDPVSMYYHPEAEQLKTMLTKYHGNRKKIADELGISTTTLWRRLKKYGIIAES